MDFDPTLLSILLGALLPVLTGIVTKQLASSKLKATVLATLSLVGAAAASFLDGGAVNLDLLVSNLAVTWVTGVATYFGLLEPVGLTNWVQTKTSNLGLGSVQYRQGSFDALLRDFVPPLSDEDAPNG